jgi:hypothetical protein
MWLSVDPEKIMPAILFSIPWLIALFEVRRGLKTGRMREYLRSDAAEGSSSRSAKYCQRSEEPKTFWCLFVFYVAILIVVPIGLVYALSHPSEEPKQNPGPVHALSNPASQLDPVP